MMDRRPARLDFLPLSGWGLLACLAWPSAAAAGPELEAVSAESEPAEGAAVSSFVQEHQPATTQGPAVLSFVQESQPATAQGPAVLSFVQESQPATAQGPAVLSFVQESQPATAQGPAALSFVLEFQPVEAVEPPEAPSNLVLEPLAPDALKASWTGASGGAAYEASASLTADFGSLATSASGPELEAVLGGLAANTRYFVRVKATNDAGASDFSATADACTLAEKPGSITPTFISGRKISLRWDAAGNPDGTRYEVRYRKQGDPDFLTAEAFDAAEGSTDLAASVEGLEPQTPYDWQARAANCAGVLTEPREALIATVFDELLVLSDGPPPVIEPAPPPPPPTGYEPPAGGGGGGGDGGGGGAPPPPTFTISCSASLTMTVALAPEAISNLDSATLDVWRYDPQANRWDPLHADFDPSAPSLTVAILQTECRDDYVFAVLGRPADKTSPVTALVIEGGKQFSAGGKLFSSLGASFKLSATDPPDPNSGNSSGVLETRLGKDGATLELYDAQPFALAEGARRLDYFSKDKAGNVEATKTSLLYMDGTPPETTLSVVEPRYEAPDGKLWLAESSPLTLTATDGTGESASGVAATSFRLDDGPPSQYTGPFLLDSGLSQRRHQANWQSVDSVGNEETEKTTELYFDSELPSLSAAVSPPIACLLPDGSASPWHRFDATISWTCSDSGSGVASCPPDILVTEEGGGQTFLHGATDNVAHHRSASVTVHLDKTTPTVAGSRSAEPNEYGWNNTDVTVSFACSDPPGANGTEGSGIASCTPPVALTEEGDHTVVGTASDRACNSASTDPLLVRIDKTAPTTALTLDGATFERFGQTYLTPSTKLLLDGADDRSGMLEPQFRVDGGAWLGTPGSHAELQLEAGTHVVEFRSLDLAGNVEAAQSRTFNVGHQDKGLVARGPNSVTLSGTARVIGGVLTNGALTASGAVTVEGDATAAEITLSGKAQVTGEQTEAEGAAHDSPFDLEAARAFAEDNDRSDDLTLTDGLLRLTGAKTLELEAGHYVLNGLELDGNARLTVKGPVGLYVLGPIKLAGQSRLNAEGRASDLAIFSEGAAFELAGSAQAAAVVYAPAAQAKLSGSARLAGHLFAEHISAAGTGLVVQSGDELPALASGGSGGGAKASSDGGFSLGEAYCFPNPAKGVSPTLHVEAGGAFSVEARVYDVSGGLVAELDLRGVLADGRSAFERAFDPPASGVYVVAAVARKTGSPELKALFRCAALR